MGIKAYAQLLGTATHDSEPSLLIFFDQNRYLFNVGEGTQRFCLEHKIRLTKIVHMFFTKMEWSCVGGLPGMLLTVADSGSKSMSLIGPKGSTFRFLRSIRHFVHRSRFDLEATELEPDFEDLVDYGDLRVLPVTLTESVKVTHQTPELEEAPLERAHTHHAHKSDEEAVKPPTRFEESQLKQGHKKTFTMTASNLEKLASGVSPTDRKRDVVCYVCHTPDVPGKFDTQKALSLGLKKGPQFGQLTQGKSITLPNGTVIHPSDCISPKQDGPIFIVVDCPSSSFLSQLKQHRAFQNYTKGGKFSKMVAFIVHIAPGDVVSSQEYKEWMSNFEEGTQHIIVNRDMCAQNLVFRATGINQYKLNAVHQSVFGLPFSSVGKEISIGGYPQNTIVGKNLTKFILGPLMSMGLDRSEELPQVEVEQVKESISKFTEFQECIQQLQIEISDKMSIGQDKKDFELVFLGTGAAIPSKYRNVSSVFMDYSEHKTAMLLDAGEGSYGQLFRKYGADLDQVISKIKVIWISHLHADHHLGTVNILLQHEQIFAGQTHSYVPLFVIGPARLGTWLCEYSNNVQPLSFNFLACSQIMDPANSVTEYMMKLFGLSKFHTVPVIHCPDSYALVIEHSSGWKLVYSGDTRPCEALVEAGKDATLLIHEATLEDEMQEDAVEKNHSTTSEAINIGMRMNAHRILLSHFSQRYPKIPTFDSKHEDRICVAFDMMTINSTNLEMLPKLLPSLRCLFKEEEEEAEREATQSKQKEERESEEKQQQPKKQKR